MRELLFGFVGAAALTMGSAASATINFGTPTGNQGPTHTYTDGSLSVQAAGYASNGGSATALYGKNNGGDESGLGLAADPSNQNEIYRNAFVQLDVSGLFGNVSDVQFLMGSTTLGEEWSVYGSNSAGSFNLADLVIGGANDEGVWHDLFSAPGWGTYQFYDFVSLGTNGQTAGNVLLGELNATPSVPEPATWAMMLLGFGAMGVAVRRTRKTVTATQLA
jgi:hypothetical protein